MLDNNMNSESKTGNQAEEKSEASMRLRELAIEFEEQLYSVRVQLKSHKSRQKEKEQELAELERIKADNRDLFSPICNKSSDTSEIVSIMEELKKHIEELQAKEMNLIDKINGIKLAADYMDELDHSSHGIHTDNKNSKVNEYGLSILEAQEVERQRIARELHDTTVQNLTSLVHKAELCAKLIDIDTIRAKLELNTMSTTLKAVINDMRGIIYNLKPMTLDDLGLTVTIQRYANKIMDTNNLQVKVHVNEEPEQILPVIKLTLFRIIQEACNNVIKHANASLITIDIMYDENMITVTIKDDGAGFNVEKTPINNDGQSSSFGLSIMNERISLLSGSLNIQSENGKGTIVTVSVPLTSYEEE